MKTLRLLFTVSLCAVLAASLDAQTTTHTMTDGRLVSFPDLTIAGSALDATVTYDAARAVYRYAYAVKAPVTNLAPIESFKVDVSGVTPRPQIDSGLQENIVRRTTVLQPATTIPVGITVPDTTPWKGAVTAGGRVLFTTRRNLYDVPPNTTLGGFVIESRLRPGVRELEITPSDKAWLDLADTLPDNGAEFTEPMPDVRAFTIKASTIGPAEVDDAALYDGGGQQPAEVNKFLRYASPLDNRIKVPANSTYTVIVYYGNTIVPGTFAATIDGVDVTSRFHPAPGGADVFTVSIANSTTKLRLSVDGTKSSGGKGTDSDTLTFLPQ